MTTFTVSPPEYKGAPFTVKAPAIESAAQVAARRLYPRTRGLTTYRTTGIRGLSGWFRAYVPDRRDRTALNSLGQPFHVGEAN